MAYMCGAASRWRQTSQGRLTAIELESLAPKHLLLHWVKIHKTG